jgi:hypothetical protein
MRYLSLPLTLKAVSSAIIGTILMTATSAKADDYNRYGYNNYGYANSEYVKCSSRDFNKRYCSVNGKIKSVYLSDRRSKAKCREGRDWGYDRKGIWVMNGCRAVFEVRYKRSRNDYGYRDRDRYRDYDRGRDYRYDDYRPRGRRAAIERCIAKAERRLRRDGFRARLEDVTNVRRIDRGWRVNMTFRARHYDHYHYPDFSCNSNRDRTRLVQYSAGRRGNQCGFTFSLNSYRDDGYDRRRYSRKYDD